ncbi:phosphoribosylglycinamide formyltransferase [Ornithinimicrobium faecis]|uniref:Phosphoribosylglycinamide formyltransferase n=1 Tax=Ornithinimicrobium faecis TaxID=2934158 RepID=A0ABY4YSH4_9MICO|nr:phosphoribosylglycinamide formyltransferase [Ornithinimicrobium sp. HY1793]USQ79721.1 phosphoribosylglycinamide formyltransferase [Ornithinimicrobium sp. HY1793]
MSLPEVRRPVVRVAILGSGSGTTAERIMDVAGSSVHAEVCLVISNKSRSGVLERARERGVPTLHLSGVTHPDPADLDAAMTKALESAGADLLVLAGFLKKIGPRTLERWGGRIVNTHPALLPAYGGVGMYGDRVHEAVLAAGATETGASIHSVTPEYDEGPVLAQVVVPVEPNDDVASLRVRVQAAEKALLVQWLTEYCGAIGRAAWPARVV